MSKAAKNEDTVPDEYTYSWAAEKSSLSIEDFVVKYKPSMVQDDGTKPWLWVRNSHTREGNENRQGAIDDATSLLAEVTEKVEKIKTDDSIPTRSNKKTGAKSKKELREQVQSEASDALKEIHKRHNYKSGKWLAFVPPDKVDGIWSRIAISVATGPLSETCVGLAKVATTPMNESPVQRLICVYMPDVFDEAKVTEVMRILLRNHGVNLSGVKSNLYTEIGLDSKHPSGIQSTVWKNTALMKDSEIKELKDAFFTDLKGEQEKDGDNKPKITGKPKAAQDDPFASDEDEDQEAKGKQVPKSKSKPVADDPFGSSDDDDKPKGKPAKTAPKRRVEEEGEEEEKPKKKVQKKR